MFDLQKVADGVYAAVAAPAYKVNSNAAIIELEDGVVVVDTHSKPSAARVVVERIRELTSKPVRYVINTHFHWDHCQGNEVYPAAFPNVEVVTSAITREALVAKGAKRTGDQLRAMPGEIAALRAELQAATSPERRAELQESLRQAEAYEEELKQLKPVLPTLAFERTMQILRTDREIQLLYLGRAHTAGDVFIHLPRERVVATGDSVIGWAPYMGDGYPEEWVETLRRLEQLDWRRMIMGHGEVAGREWLGFFRSYLEDLIQAVRREAAAGASLQEVLQRVPDQLAPRYEPGFSKYPTYRPWRRQVVGNLERVYAAVS
jgi:glyoxylase-like metal-dependent hydrolase (beta-lactamase superfamily II)